MEADLFICFCYIPPKDSIYFKNVETDFFDLLENGIRHYSHFGKVSVIGDLNVRTGLLSDEPMDCEGIDRYIDSINGAELNEPQNYEIGRRYSLDLKSDSSGLRLLNICKEASLRIVNGRLGLDAGQGNFTYQSVLGKSVIDYVLLQPEMFENVIHFAVHGIYTFSDHAPVQISFDIKERTPVESQNKVVHKLVWDKNRVDCFRNALSDNLLEIDFLVDRIENGNLNIDDGVEIFGTILYNSANQVFGKNITVKSGQSHSTRKYTSPWFTIDCEIARSELKRANKEFRKYKTHAAHEVLLQKRKHYSKIKRRAQTVFRQSERIRLHDLATSNPKAFWSEIRRMKDDKSKRSNVSLQAFYDHFKEIYSENSDFKIDQVDAFIEDNFSQNNENAANRESNINLESLDSPFTNAEVSKAFLKLKRNKSPGLDLLPPELFIDSSDLICAPICKLFNCIFSSNNYPLSWTKGIIVPVPKKGDLSDVNNYRGITLTSIFSKLYSHILDNRLRSWAEDNNIINDNQFGFRENKSTVDCLFILQTIVNIQLHKKRKMYCAFVDFKKAFDLVYRNGIWFKLCESDAPLAIVKAIKAIYNSVKVCVRNLGSISDCFDSLVGVKQGEPLSPLLFILFLNDLAEELNIDNNYFENNDIINQFQKFILLFADDTLLLAESHAELQILLNKLYVYCKKWNLTVNTGKTKVMLFKLCNIHEQFNIFYDEVQLEVVNTFIYLGVNVSSNGKFYQAQKHLSEQALKAMFALKNVFDSNVLCVKDKLKLFESLIQPILMYGCEIWGFHKADDIEKVHIKFLKQVLGVRRQTCNLAVYGELGRVPLAVLRKIRILKYWKKILSSHESLLHKVYVLQVNELNSGIINENNWAFQLKSILDELGFSYLWNDQCISNLQLEMVTQSLYDQYFQGWYGDINSSNKLETIKSLNKVFAFEKYLTCINVDSHRIALSRFRCSAHKLLIEEGRYRNIERGLRICQFCNLNVVENEYHFLMVCPSYRNLRNSILPKYYCSWPSKNKFIKLLNEKQTGNLKRLGKYLWLANEKRNDMLGY